MVDYRDSNPNTETSYVKRLPPTASNDWHLNESAATTLRTSTPDMPATIFWSQGLDHHCREACLWKKFQTKETWQFSSLLPVTGNKTRSGYCRQATCLAWVYQNFRRLKLCLKFRLEASGSSRGTLYSDQRTCHTHRHRNVFAEQSDSAVPSLVVSMVYCIRRNRQETWLTPLTVRREIRYQSRSLQPISEQVFMIVWIQRFGPVSPYNLSTLLWHDQGSFFRLCVYVAARSAS